TVGDMAALLDACNVERAIVGGLSLGGVMSLAFHLAHPERVAALMLFDTGPGFRNPEARGQWNERALARARDLDESGLAARRGGEHGSRGGGADGLISGHSYILWSWRGLPRPSTPF